MSLSCLSRELSPLENQRRKRPMTELDWKRNSHTPNNTNEPYLDWLNYTLTLDDDELPRTVSISYGDDEQTVPADYANHDCDMFAALGSRGVSVMVSSGDDGNVANVCCVLLPN